MRIVLAVLLATALSGCAALDGGPYRDAYIRFAETGAAVRPYRVPAPNDAVQALYDSFDRQVNEGLAAKDAK